MISAIVLHGFKSFADRTRIEFTEGICAVIGPNGSGKSNVVEAIRWATHNAKARDLRAVRGSELIFHGSGGKAPLGMAEVQLELRTTQGRLNLSRRVYRDGTFEQDLGGKTVRARDIQAALRGTGLGIGGLAVIGQGEVGSVIQAEGKTLLGYLQEAAGLSRMVAARHEVQSRLDEADLSLSQLQLILQQKEEVLMRLAQAVTATREHHSLSLQLAALEETLQREKYLALLNEIESARQEEHIKTQQAQDLSTQITTVHHELETVQTLFWTTKEKAQAFQAAFETLKAATETAMQAERYRDHLQDEYDRLQQELSALHLIEPQETIPDTTALQSSLVESRTWIARAEQGIKQVQRDQEQLRQRQTQQLQDRTRLEATLATLQAQQTQLTEQEKDIAASVIKAGTTVSELSEKRLLTRQELVNAKQQQAQSLQEQQQLQRRINEVQAHMMPLQREYDRLQATLDTYSRYGEGSRNALRLDHAGIVGSVADLLHVQADFEVALSAALGKRLEQVVVERAEDAREIIEELRRVGGRATFLPLELLRSRFRREERWLKEAGVLGYLVELCPTDPPLVGENLLGDTLLVQDMNAAQRIARIHAARPRMVTLLGDLVESSGAMTGGRLKDSGSAVLADQRRIREITDERNELQHVLVESQALLADHSQQLQQLEKSLAQAEQQDTQVAQQLQQAERLLAEKQTQQKSIQRTIQQLVAQLSALPTLQSEPIAETEQASLEEALYDWNTQLQTAREKERAQLDALGQAREITAAWKSYQQGKARSEQLQERMNLTLISRTAQDEQVELAHREVARRKAALGEFDSTELVRLEKQYHGLQQQHKSLLLEQETLKQRIEELALWIARKEGGLGSLAAGCVLPPAGRGSVATLRKKIADREPINARAEQDYAHEETLIQEQQQQYNDAKQAVHTLREHLAELSRQEAEATKQAFTRVNTAFIEYSTELLGGTGIIEDEWDNGILVGLKLAVQPKGKKTRSMNLLSAGERTMAGLAFLFALNHAQEKGALPLAVLDEVDAPLDEANIRRFTAFLQRFGKCGTQFVVVTHQKATMEAAQALWGVTTEQGVSRVLSIKQRHEG